MRKEWRRLGMAIGVVFDRKEVCNQVAIRTPTHSQARKGFEGRMDDYIKLGRKDRRLCLHSELRMY